MKLSERLRQLGNPNEPFSVTAGELQAMASRAESLELQPNMEAIAAELALALKDLLTDHSDYDMDAVSVAYDNMLCDAKVGRAQSALRRWESLNQNKQTTP